MGCVEAKQFKHTVKPVNVVVADTNERSEASARRRKKVEEQHQRSKSVAKSISNVALQNSEKLSTATDRSRKSFISELLALNETNQQESSSTNETEKPSTSLTPTDPLPASHTAGNPKHDGTPHNLPNNSPDKQFEDNSKTPRKSVAFEDPLIDASNDTARTDKTIRDVNGNDEQSDVTTGSTNSTASLQKVQCYSNGNSNVEV